MPDKVTLARARKAKREGKAPSTQAGEFVREEIEHVREGKHGARSTEQAIAIGLSKARRAGVELPVPKKGTTSERTRRSADKATRAATKSTKRPSAKRSRAALDALKDEPHRTVSRKALAEHAHEVAASKPRAARSPAARKAAKTKGPAGRSAAANKAARTRARKTRSGVKSDR